MTPIKLLISDVDGTLVTKDKRLTPASIEAVRELRARGIQFSITSSRPPFGMRMLREPLNLDLPMGAFNGSSIVRPDLSVDEQQTIPRNAVTTSLALFARYGVDAWIFTNQHWVVHRDDGPYVAHEKRTIDTNPLLVMDDTPYLDKACKIVGVSADFDLLARCEPELQAALGSEAHAARSQNYYLDVTPPGYDKGTFVKAMARRLNIPPQAIATVGDMTNDIPMFRASGLSFAMGNATDAIKAQAIHVTASNEEDGFAKAVATILTLNS
ncbi:Cof subfamily protein (haloacid dehalogenase superfamily) [Nitrobacteraceae bacterium AZCC 1564]